MITNMMKYYIKNQYNLLTKTYIKNIMFKNKYQIIM